MALRDQYPLLVDLLLTLSFLLGPLVLLTPVHRLPSHNLGLRFCGLAIIGFSSYCLYWAVYLFADYLFGIIASTLAILAWETIKTRHQAAKNTDANV